MGKLVYGVGFYERGVYVASRGGKLTKVYSVWTRMLRRAYCEKFKEKHPTYANVTASEEFLVFQEFGYWCHKQTGYSKGFDLDKDLLKKDNLVYSPTTCCFLPHEINCAVNRQQPSRGKHPIGVYECELTGVYSARVAVGSDTNYLGQYATSEEAFGAYKLAKEANLKRLAKLYRGSISEAAYRALMEYQVEIND